MIRESLYSAARELVRQPWPIVREVLSGLSNPDKRALELVLKYDWAGLYRREKQRPPPGDWLWCAWLCGRGFGKTRTSTELIRECAENGEDEYVSVIAATSLTLKRDMIDGPSGIMNVSPPWFRPTHHPTRAELRWPKHPLTGVRMRATLMSGEKPDRIRGDEVSKAFLDELPTWQSPELSWTNVELMLRRGANCRGYITATLKRSGPGSLFSRDLLWGKRGEDGVRRPRPDLVVIHGHTSENTYLDEKTRAGFMRRFGGTADEVTELAGGLPREAEGALWVPEIIEQFRVELIPPGVTLERVITVVDPSRSKVGTGDIAGIITMGLGSDKHVYVFADDSLRKPPDVWMEKAVSVAELHRVDEGIYEQNRLGEDLVTLLREKARASGQHWRPVTARGTKLERAEPVSVLYKAGRVHHVGALPELEEEQCAWDPKEKHESPNRIDALVHGVRELLLSETAQRKPLVVR